MSDNAYDIIVMAFYYYYTRGASLFLVHKKVHLDYAVSDQTNRSYPNEPLTLYR